jgi:hypothetical protein
MQNDSIEREINDKGLNAPRVTLADVEAEIVSEHYFTAANGLDGTPADCSMAAYDALKLLTFCVLILRNGFTVTGESACVSPENFDAEKGRKIARQHAVDKVWPLMGYELKSKLNAEKVHFSDCSVHNEPYMPNGECDCK